MSAAAAAAVAPATEAPKKKSKKLLFIVLGMVVLAILGAAAALFILKKNTAEDDYEDEDHVAVQQQVKSPKTAPIFLPLENMVINLADAGGNRFIQLGLTLQLQDTATETAVKAYLPSIRSQVLVLISQRTADEMLALKGKEKLASDIIATISREMGYAVSSQGEGEEAQRKRKTRAAPNPVQAVLFSSFIVQ